MDVQILLFEMARDRIGKEFSVAEAISDILNINIDAAYRRLRGKTRLTIDEVVKLCTHFDFSVDHALQLNTGDNTILDYKSVDLTNVEDYYSYIEKYAAIFVKLASLPEKEIITLTHNIPFYRLANYPEVSFFNLYVWSQSANAENHTYEHFVKGLDTEKIIRAHSKVTESVKRIPIAEIWTTEIYNSLLNLIEYYYDLGRFENKEVPLTLCRQILSLVDDMERWSCDSVIDFKGQTAPYSLYASPLRITPNFSIIKTGNANWGFIHLSRMQSMCTVGEKFCMEINKFLKNIMVDSLYINGASLKERHQTFHNKRIAFEKLIDKIQTENNAKAKGLSGDYFAAK